MKLLEFIPSEAWLIALIGAGLVATTQTVRLSDAQRQIAQHKEAAAVLRADNERAAREHDNAIEQVRREHTLKTQEKENAFQEDMAAVDRRRIAAVADAGRLRDQLAAATARGRPGSAPGPASCERDRDRLESLGKLAGEGAELLAQARSLLDQRELELRRVLDQITADRAAVEKAAGVVPAEQPLLPDAR